ncbi:MAG: phosphoserine phosphatase SerB [Alphaproteobacteria bacterium]
MSLALVLVAGSAEGHLADTALADARGALARRGIAAGMPERLGPDAGEMAVAGGDAPTVRGEATAALAGTGIDVFAVPAEGRRKRLLVADMEATVIENELLDDMARMIGRADEVAAITRAAMEGALDFADALRARVALFAGLPAAALDAAARGIRPAAGAATLVRTMAAHGAATALVSGGFTIFVEPVAAMLGFASAFGNVLGRTGEGGLTGAVDRLDVTAEGKRVVLERLAADHRIRPAATLAIGDGANDIPMLEAAGLAIGVRPKPAVARAVVNHIVHGDLTAALYAQGYRRAEFATG